MALASVKEPNLFWQTPAGLLREFGFSNSYSKAFLILGRHEHTRLLEQIQSFFPVVYIDPSEKEIRKLFKGRMKKSFRLENRQIMLFVFHNPLDKELRRNLLMNGRHAHLAFVFLFNGEPALGPPELAQIDQLFIFPSPFLNISRIARQFREADFSLYDQVPRGQCLWVRTDFEESKSQIFRPWPKSWSKETHFEFSHSVQKRVWLLLRGQSDPASPLSRLDKNCLLRLLEAGAGLDL